MSADNGIYVASFPTIHRSLEYRVAYAMAIENVDHGDERSQDLHRAAIFGNASTFADRSQALLHAHELAHEYDTLEYGVSDLIFDRPLLDISREDLKKEMDDMYRSYAPKPTTVQESHNLTDIDILMDTLLSTLGDTGVRNILLALRERISYKYEAQLLRSYHTLKKQQLWAPWRNGIRR